MSISNIESGNPVCSLNLANTEKAQSVKNPDLANISDDFSESEETHKFKEIIEKYDITNMSRNEVKQMYKELYDNKLISLKDMAMTIFDPTRIPGWQDGVSSVSGWKISSNPDQKMNFLEGLKTQADWNKKHGDSEFQHNYDERLALAEKIYYLQSH